MTARRLGWVGAALAAVVLIGALAWGIGRAAGSSQTSLLGKPAPDFEVVGLWSGHVRLSELRGRPVVLNFWASWCAACRQEEGVLNAAALHRPAHFLGVDVQDSLGAARARATQAQFPYAVGQVPGGVPSAYRVKGIPDTLFIDPEGVVVARYVGPLDASLMDRYLQLLGVR